jgi:pSer/pThr/pTyr-binding forkhead associated (FHA) protein
LKGYNEGTGIFLKIEEKMLIEPEEKYIFLFNQKSFLNILIQESSNLVFFDYNGESKGEYNYKEKNSIFIGRSQKCNLVLNDEDGVSRVQFTLFYDKNNNEFYLYDGFYCDEEKKIKSSTNGIWLLLNNNKILIKNEMIFKTGKTLILCQYKEN